MNRERLWNDVFVLLRVGVGALFVVSGYSKLLAPYENFAGAIQSYQLVTGFLADAAARTLPWTELVGGVCLVLGLWTRASVALLWALNHVFLLALGQALYRGLPIDDCGCFGKAIRLSPAQTFLADVGLWVVFLALFVFPEYATAASLDRRYEKR